MAKLNYTTRGIRRRRDSDKWEITLSHKDPLTGEQIRTFHTVEAKTQKQAERKRDELILDLERKGGAVASGITVREFMERFLDYKEKSGTIEPSTVRSYRTETKLICKYIGAEKLTEVGIATVNGWMADMTRDGYAPKSVTKPFRLFKQALKWAVAQDLITKNPCDFCKPPKRVKTPINALGREERTRMMQLALPAWRLRSPHPSTLWALPATPPLRRLPSHWVSLPGPGPALLPPNHLRSRFPCHPFFRLSVEMARGTRLRYLPRMEG